jgi:hypothetical protein
MSHDRELVVCMAIAIRIFLSKLNQNNVAENDEAIYSVFENVF